MTARGKEAAALALHRFGFGPARDSIVAIAADPRGALLSDLDRPGAGYLAAKLPSSGAAARAISDFRAEEQAKAKLARRAKKEAEANNASANFDCRKAPSAPPCAAPPVQNDAGTSNRRNFLNHRCRNKYSRTKPQRATRQPSAPTSASSSG